MKRKRPTPAQLRRRRLHCPKCGEPLTLSAQGFGLCSRGCDMRLRPLADREKRRLREINRNRRRADRRREQKFQLQTEE